MTFKLIKVKPMNVKPWLLASAIAQILFAQAATASEVDQPVYSGTRGTVNDDSWVYQRPFPNPGERQLPSEQYRVWGLEELLLNNGSSDLKQLQFEQVDTVEYQKSIEHVRFDSGRTLISQQHSDRISALLAQLADRKNLRIHIIGHTDPERLTTIERARYGDNYGLGLDRAKQVGRLFIDALDLPESAVSYESQGPDQPIADNDSEAGMALNRRVELQLWYDTVNTETRLVEQSMCRPDQESGEATITAPASDNPFRSSIDGQQQLSAVTTATDHGDADQQRCTDIALEQADIQLQYDNLSQRPRLAVSTGQPVALYNQPLRFQGYSNYLYWIDRAEVRLLDSQGREVATIELDEALSASWIPTKPLPNRLYYQLRVYDQQQRFDDTDAIPLQLTDNRLDDEPQDTSSAAAEEQANLAAGYGENRLRNHRIPISGGVVTINGKGVEADQQVSVMGHQINTDSQGRFVTQQIIPRGLHQIEVAVLDPQGQGRVYRRDLRLPENDWFTVALADITAGKNSSNGPAQEMNADDYHFNGDSFIDGRLAFYTKGKVDDSYTVTASADTGEQEFKHLFSGISDKNSRYLLRRMDATRHWPTFGDDSTLIEDAPTQGKFYAKVEQDHSHALWGNFKAEHTDTELAQINRALYGAQLSYAGDEFTANGEHQLQLDGFAAEPGTLPAREDFRGTGGSVFFLRHQDITTGSERVRIEVRDRDSGLVLNSETLSYGQDYDIDSIQGRILLSSPLSSVASNSQLVRSSSLAGHPSYLVVDYEYTPGFTELSDLATAGRAAYWVNDNVKLGVTNSSQEQLGATQDMTGVDLTLRHSNETWVKIEQSQTDGAGQPQHSSDDGGFDFDSVNTGGGRAGAGRVEAAFSVADLTGNAESQGLGTFYIEQREDGFSAPGRLTDGDTDQVGGSFTTPLSDDVDLTVKADDRHNNDGDDNQAIEANLLVELNEDWSVGTGLRSDKQNGASLDSGQRDDLAVQLNYAGDENWSAWGFGQGTLHKSGDRDRNHRAGVGSRVQVSDRTAVNGEMSDGNRGFGLMAGVDYQWTDRTNIYTNYQLDNDRSDNGIRSRNGQWVSGLRSRWTDSLSIYAEGRQQIGTQGDGLMQAYGLDYSPTDRWNYGASLELGSINSESDDQIDRTAITGSIGYQYNRQRYAGALEYREDQSDNETRITWLWRNNYSAQVAPEWRAIARLDTAFSESNLGEIYSGDFIDSSLGYAYRPIDNDRFNALLKYSYLYDLAPEQQLNPGDVNTVDYAQRSQVFAVDGTYDLTQRWSLGGKYAYRIGELRASRDDSAEWFDSKGQLIIVRTDWHVVHAWDLTMELRRRDEFSAEDSRAGALLAGYRHFGEHLKFGVGYNFSDFSDDLTDMDYDAKGLFVNLIGKY